MLNLLTPYKWPILILSTIVLILAAYFGAHHFIAKEQQIGYNKAIAEYTTQALKAEQLARAKEAALSAQVKAAQDKALERERQIEKLNSDVIASNNRLRDTIAANQRKLSQLTRDAADRYAKALGDILQECSDRYSKLANETDKCASDNETLKQAWPK